MKNTYIVIMAGGEGTRFAPLSTPERPKQFLNFVGELTFIQHTRERVRQLVAPENIYVATNERYVDLVHEQLPDVPRRNIIAEPVKKNTAPCIAYAARLIHDRDPNACMVMLPSDHVILRPDIFIEAVKVGIGVARQKRRMVTIGITPSWPATELGYIKAKTHSKTLLLRGKTPCETTSEGETPSPPLKAAAPHPSLTGSSCPSQSFEMSSKELSFPWKRESLEVFPVHTFVEKPDESTARSYLADGNFFWNSGMFIWTTATVLFEITTHLPRMHKLLSDFNDSDEYRRSFFNNCDAISIDYAVLEKATDMSVIPADLGWSDVGTWQGLSRLAKEARVKLAPEVVEVMNKVLSGGRVKL